MSFYAYGASRSTIIEIQLKAKQSLLVIEQYAFLDFSVSFYNSSKRSMLATWTALTESEMYTKRIIDPHYIWYFSWRPLLYTLVTSTTVYVLYHAFHLHSLVLPFLPIATVGTAVAFYVGFKNNSSYDRLWEARKIWGEVTNVSRSMAAYLTASFRNNPESTQEMKAFVCRHLAFINMLRL